MIEYRIIIICNNSFDVEKVYNSKFKGLEFIYDSSEKRIYLDLKSTNDVFNLITVNNNRYKRDYTAYNLDVNKLECFYIY